MSRRGHIDLYLMCMQIELITRYINFTYIYTYQPAFGLLRRATHLTGADEDK